jgi:hypothetical protein
MNYDVYCVKCGQGLKCETYKDNSNGIFVHACEKCNAASERTKMEHRLLLNFLNKNDITYGDEVAIENGLNLLTKELGYLGIVEDVINKIIPEYKNVPLEYKIFLFKERVNSAYITSSDFYFNETKINKLADALFNKNRIVFIKNIREFTGYGLKDAKDLVDTRIPKKDFERTWNSIEEVRKVIIEKF